MDKQEGRWKRVWWWVFSIALLVVMAVSTRWLVDHSPTGLEYPIWAALIGLVANALASLLKVREKLGVAIRTELFLKIGLILLGAGVNMTLVMSVGARGLIQGVLMVVSVFFFTWWLGGMLGLESKLRAVMATAVSICGVSAAIAAAGSVLAKKEHLAYISALVIVTALPLMVLMPYLATQISMSPQWAGAWFGGNIDTTAAVVGAGTIYGEEAASVASIVKMAQNALIGVAAFGLARYWALHEERNPEVRPSPKVIWDRFPKFVLGFILASILASLGVFSKEQSALIKQFRDWALMLAFIGIGWDLAVGEFKKMGIRPVLVYLAATIFNTLLAFGVARAFFG
jgi:uncharacterized integral membrane protein (TIGR00698 family)